MVYLKNQRNDLVNTKIIFTLHNLNKLMMEKQLETKFKVEYVWLDGYTPEPNLRSKTKIISKSESDEVELEDLPIWSFDGSSTQQAEGHFSDCLLKPVKLVKDAARGIGCYIALCEVLNPDGTAHKTNTRANLKDGEDNWYGFEQEYTFIKDGRPVGFPKDGYPAPQGQYYCGVGGGLVSERETVETHLSDCLECGLNITGINAEVLLGQWEFQVFGKGAKDASDQLWIARYLLHRLSEEKGFKVEFHPKPLTGDWNGSGLHTNFSTKSMRETGGKDLFDRIFTAFEQRHKEHIANYGSSNEQRLTGKHETQSIDKFSWGISDRGSSIRVPLQTANGWKGYVEDRRPASNADPYRIVNVIEDSLTIANAL
jgi:glutamine synthetase